MATQGKGAPYKRKASIPTSEYSFPPVPVANTKPLEQDWESVMGWLFCCLLIVFLLPLTAILYVDVLVVKHEVTEQIQRLEKLKKQIESEQRKDKDK